MYLPKTTLKIFKQNVRNTLIIWTNLWTEKQSFGKKSRFLKCFIWKIFTFVIASYFQLLFLDKFQSTMNQSRNFNWEMLAKNTFSNLIDYSTTQTLELPSFEPISETQVSNTCHCHSSRADRISCPDGNKHSIPASTTQHLLVPCRSASASAV